MKRTKVQSLIRKGLVPANYDELVESRFPLTYKKLQRFERPVRDDLDAAWHPIVFVILALWAQLILILYIYS